MPKSVYVKFVGGRVYDAFWGQGWEHWTRFLVKKGEAIYIKGQEITNDDKKVLVANLPKAEEE